MAFFFSSRRRHTRLTCDWSSDVCSSDLQDVGVNIDLTPRVHPNHEVSLKLKVEVSAHTSDVSIGGITQPVISQRVIEHDIRLKEGEVSILGGLIQRSDSKTLEGWPGLAKLDRK